MILGKTKVRVYIYICIYIYIYCFQASYPAAVNIVKYCEVIIFRWNVSVEFPGVPPQDSRQLGRGDVASKKHASGADLFFQRCHTVTFSDSMSRILSHFGSPPYISLHLMMDPEQNLHTAEYI